MCQGSSHFRAFLHHFVLAKLDTGSIRDKLGTGRVSQRPHYGCVAIQSHIIADDNPCH